MVPGRAYCLLGSDCPIIVSWDLSHGQMVLLTCLVLSRYVLPLATAFIDVWGCTSTLSVVVDWLTECARVIPWSWVSSIRERLIDASCDSLLTWYFVSHDRLVLYLLQLAPPFPTATVLGLQSYSYWMLLFTLNATPTSRRTWITVPTIVDVTY